LEKNVKAPAKGTAVAVARERGGKRSKTWGLLTGEKNTRIENKKRVRKKKAKQNKETRMQREQGLPGEKNTRIVSLQEKQRREKNKGKRSRKRQGKISPQKERNKINHKERGIELKTQRSVRIQIRTEEAEKQEGNKEKEQGKSRKNKRKKERKDRMLCCHNIPPQQEKAMGSGGRAERRGAENRRG
jgi:hypothetical protein